MTELPALTVDDSEDRRRVKRYVASAVVGNFMEYFDFASFGFLAGIIGAQFFPSGDPALQLLSSLAAFGVSFLFRPLGGVVFGFVGDRFGRKVALTTEIVVMSLSTAAIGVLPTPATIGFLAPLLLVVARAIQGISVGGEFAGASTFIVEYAPAARRGLWSSYMSTTAALGTVAGSSLVLLLTSISSPQVMNDWGWRVPFLLGLPMGIVGLYMRLKLSESPVFEELKKTDRVARNPYAKFGWPEIRSIGIVAVFAGSEGVAFYYFATYFNSYLSATVGFSSTQAIILSTASLVVYSGLCPLAGMFCDRFGRRRPAVLGFLILAVLAIPIFLLLGTGFLGALAGLIVFAIPLSVINVLVSLLLAELFSAETRVSGGAVGHNIGVGLFGGTSPLVAATLVAHTHDSLSPSYYLAAALIVGGVVMIFALPRTGRQTMFSTDHPRRPTTDDDGVSRSAVAHASDGGSR